MYSPRHVSSRRGRSTSRSTTSASGGEDISFTNTSDLEHRKSKAAYYAMIEPVDKEVSRMLDALEETGQVDNTIAFWFILTTGAVGT